MQEPAPAPAAVPVHFDGGDWAVLLGYFALLAWSGWWFARRENKDTDDYFLGGRRMPPWAVALSIVATSLSAASFVGVPAAGYGGDLTYLFTNVGMVLAAIVVAFVFIPAFYSARVQSVYGLLESRCGPLASRAASVAFLIGRLLASGARVYVAAIPLSMILFGVESGMEPANLLLAVVVLGIVGVLYTLVGGIAAVIWTDVLQFVVFVVAAGAAIGLIGSWLVVPWSDVFAALDENAKLRLVSLDTDPRTSFTLWTSVIGFTLLGIGSYGTDQDLSQRMLTCSDAKKGSRSVLMGILMGIPSVAIFLAVGLCLWIFHQRPEFVGAHAPLEGPANASQVFLEFILEEMPSGLRGLMMAGLFAAALSSVNSTINAMSSTFVADLYRKFAPGRGEPHYLAVGRRGVVWFGVALSVVAALCVWWQSTHTDGGGNALLDFVLGVMVFAYSGLVGVFLCVLLLGRGSERSVIAALVTGFVLVLLAQPWMPWVPDDLGAGRAFGELGFAQQLAATHFTWKFTASVAVTFAICALGGRTHPRAATAT
jgi:SSS family transporter